MYGQSDQSFVHQNNLFPKAIFPVKTYAITFLYLKQDRQGFHRDWVIVIRVLPLYFTTVKWT